VQKIREAYEGFLHARYLQRSFLQWCGGCLSQYRGEASSHHRQQVHQQICGGVQTLRSCSIRSQCCQCCWNRSCRLKKRSCLCQCWMSHRYLCRCWRIHMYLCRCWRIRRCRGQCWRKRTHLFQDQSRWCYHPRTRLFRECCHGRQCHHDRDHFHGCSPRSRCHVLDHCSGCCCRSLSPAIGTLISK
jgi:hypothetical protein